MTKKTFAKAALVVPLIILFVTANVATAQTNISGVNTVTEDNISANSFVNTGGTAMVESGDSGYRH